VTTTVRTSDGRTLAVEESGDPQGSAVFLLHGMPGSRLGPRPRGMRLYQLGVRLITYDRPGYGDSERKEGRHVADVVPDVTAIADQLRITSFAVLGRSGGGPHALACAALVPDRVKRVAVMVGLAPREAEGLDWYAGMTASNVDSFDAAANGHESLAAKLNQLAAKIRANPASLLTELDAELPEADRRVVGDVGIRAKLIEAHAEALRTSAFGWIDDVHALATTWGFLPSEIGVPAMLWHGATDVFSPIGHTMWLAGQIPGATVVVQPDAAHFAALEVLPDVLLWLVSGKMPL
jgi:pimeloyl-ACP methyl ester carboxylesterase